MSGEAKLRALVKEGRLREKEVEALARGIRLTVCFPPEISYLKPNDPIGSPCLYVLHAREGRVMWGDEDLGALRRRGGVA